MSDLRRAIHYAAGRLALSYDAALLLPVRVVVEMWEEKQRTDAAGVAASREEREDHADGKDGDR